MKFKKVCVLGLGYIGLPTASTLATHGLQVVGVDVNPQIVQGLQNGKLHLYEPGLRTLVQAALHSGNLVVRDTPEPADAFIIAVQTPFLEDKRADLRFVRAASEAIVPYLQRGNLVVLESTSPPLTTRQVVAPILERSGLKAGQDFYLVYSPERVLPGQILRELIENARVVGGIDRASAEAARDLYATFVRGDIILTDCTTAEMVKLMENTFRDVNIALANEFARLADRLGIDVWEAIALANRHPRVNILRPGPGVGGHCISVDPWFLVEVAPDLTRLIRAARDVNDSQPDFVVEWMERTLGRLDGRRVAALGLAYKPDVDDLRESPAIEVALRLVEAGARVQAFEPFKPEAQIPGVPTVTSLDDALKEAEILLLLVGHTSLRELNPDEVRAQTSARLVFDAVNGWDQTRWQKAGFQVWRLGVGREDV
ncbi:nucleotide sugar dehydrogenase [Thermanaerothrix sp.]|uniref:nucleotide sugar dehydrogenase n=1 Tax=Thermanaerothrix sp. TaxID=2972675 RepID=UPI002ADD46FB|nr:nucleotide sugar dehydrogenase [Thermanaerothrix sp.]